MDFHSLGLNKPDRDEIECTVFGAGKGECILLHLGNEQWIVIDSFLNRRSRTPVALEYLNKIGVTLDNITHVVATHWHDDHVKGISEIFEKANNAKFVIPTALTSDEFLEIAELRGQNKKIPSSLDSGVDELKKVLDLSSARVDGGKPQPILFLGANTILQNTNSKVIAISPSSQEVLDAIKSFSKFIPQASSKKVDRKRLPTLKPNDTALALLVETMHGSILLGSDLETSKNANVGWVAAHQCALGLQKPKSILFKVPHHGSLGAHYQLVWDDLLVSNPHAAVTPFNSSHLPRNSDMHRINNQTPHAAIAGGLPDGRYPRSVTVDKTIRNFTKGFRPVSGKVGFLRYRFNSTSGLSLQAFGNSEGLTSCYQRVTAKLH